MQSNETLSRFDLLLEDMIMSRNKYAKSPKANPLYLKNQDVRINELVEIRNSIERVGNIDLWCDVNSRIKEVEAKDSTINNFLIELKCGDANKRQAHIPIQIRL